MTESIAISAIVTGYNRETQLLATLACISAATPPPDEILVHIDGGKTDLAATVQRQFPNVQVIKSQTRIGPGGGRNRLIGAAKHNWIASFDDDSQPIDLDYFARVRLTAESQPSAAVVAAQVFLPHEEQRPLSDSARQMVDFVGCGCVFRRDVFMKTSGYVPLPIAYGMEEVDLAIRLVALDQPIIQTGQLRVLHSTDEAHHRDPEITAGTISNIALLAYLRYPWSVMPVGVIQCITRIIWLLARRRTRGILAGIFSIPRQIWTHRSLRDPVSLRTFVAYNHLRRHPVTLD